MTATGGAGVGVGVGRGVGVALGRCVGRDVAVAPGAIVGPGVALGVGLGIGLGVSFAVGRDFAIDDGPGVAAGSALAPIATKGGDPSGVAVRDATPPNRPACWMVTTTIASEENTKRTIAASRHNRPRGSTR